jgi:hypothetical protein
MPIYSLNVSQEEADIFRWVLVEIDGERVLPHSHAACGFDSYEAALNAGTLALAAADGEEFENEAADPVGDADCTLSDQQNC